MVRHICFTDIDMSRQPISMDCDVMPIDNCDIRKACP